MRDTSPSLRNNSIYVDILKEEGERVSPAPAPPIAGVPSPPPPPGCKLSKIYPPQWLERLERLQKCLQDVQYQITGVLSKESRVSPSAKQSWKTNSPSTGRSPTCNKTTDPTGAPLLL
ncbi:UNVERIFIED_CONTAM: hypothetical protein Sangu_2844000 [Sesamum angustifolium]|uniref:Uncharacterized protein n=1 Tax=Sesamum angustifolium TaxID=2727405 RepID=A0AAW2IQN9_9LAMI